MEDVKIIDLYWQRDENAISETARKYGGFCFGIACNILGNREDSEECVEDSYMAAWNAMPPQRPRFLKAFLAAITRNLSLSRIRERLRLKRGGGEAVLALEELEDCVPAASDVEAEYDARELSREISRFLKTVSDNDRRIFISRYWFVLPVSEIAARMSMPQSRIKNSLYRSRRRLAEHLEKEGLV